MEAKYTEIGPVQDFFTVLYVYDSQVNKCQSKAEFGP